MSPKFMQRREAGVPDFAVAVRKLKIEGRNGKQSRIEPGEIYRSAQSYRWIWLKGGKVKKVFRANASILDVRQQIANVLGIGKTRIRFADMTPTELADFARRVTSTLPPLEPKGEIEWMVVEIKTWAKFLREEDARAFANGRPNFVVVQHEGLTPHEQD